MEQCGIPSCRFHNIIISTSHVACTRSDEIVHVSIVQWKIFVLTAERKRQLLKHDFVFLQLRFASPGVAHSSPYPRCATADNARRPETVTATCPRDGRRRVPRQKDREYATEQLPADRKITSNITRTVNSNRGPAQRVGNKQHRHTSREAFFEIWYYT